MRTGTKTDFQNLYIKIQGNWYLSKKKFMCKNLLEKDFQNLKVGEKQNENLCLCHSKISTTLFLVATGSWLFHWASLTKMPHLGYNCTWIIGYNSDHLQLFQGNLQLQLQSSSGGSRLLLIIMQSQSLPYKFWLANVPSTKISKKKIGNFIVYWVCGVNKMK